MRGHAILTSVLRLYGDYASHARRFQLHGYRHADGRFDAAAKPPCEIAPPSRRQHRYLRLLIAATLPLMICADMSRPLFVLFVFLLISHAY